MGPTILLDKSAFQSLNQTEIRFLYRHFCVLIPDILIREIVADLTIKPGESEATVQNLIGKFRPIGNYINAPYSDICISNLYGHPYPMDGRIVMMGGEEVVDDQGQKGIVYGPDPRWDLMRKWKAGRFSQDDINFSRVWRDNLKNLDWESLVRSNPFGKSSRATNLNDLHIESLNLYTQGPLKKQLRHLNSFMDYLDIPVKNQNEIADKFLESERGSFFRYARYAFFCFSLNQTFAVGLFNRIISTRNSGILDLEYLYYLPFCQVFATKDNFQYDFANVVRGPFHTIIRGEDLKTALSGLAARYNNLSEDGRRVYEREYGSYPPFDDQSIVSDIWKKYCRPWRPKSGNTADDLATEQKEKIIASVMGRINPQRKKQTPPP